MPDEPSRRAEAAPPPEPVESSVGGPEPRTTESTPNGGETAGPAASRPPAPNPPLITAIVIENFKGIGRPMRVELRPVTLLFGNNSAGKSTVLQALCYAHEILSRGNVDAHATELGGDRIDLGGFRNFVHAHDTTRAVRLRFELNLETWDDVPKPVLDSLVFEYGNATFEWDVTDLTGEAASGWIELLVELRGERPFLSHYEVGVNEALVGRLREREPLDVVLEFDAAHPLLRKETHRWGGGRAEPAPAEREGVRLQAAAQAGRLRDAGGSEAGDGWRLSHAKTRRLGRALPYWNQPLLLDVQGPAGAAGDDDASYGFSALVSTLFLGIGKTLGDELARLRYIGPVRALHPPTRIASPPDDDLSRAVLDFLDDRAATPGPRSSRAAAWADGSAAWTMLLDTPFKLTGRSGHNLISDASVWLKDRFDTGYALRDEPLVTIERSRLDELKKRAELPDLERMNELDELAAGTPQQELRLVTAKSGLPVRPSDIGTGVSQILPVVVAALDPNRPGVTAVEQPDLHLHPRVQVELGDLFAQGIGQGGVFLIETHSEHLLLRIMKRMRQTSDGTLPDGAPAIRPEDVAVFFVEIDPGGEQTLIREMPLNECGELVEAWPGGFFEEDLREIF